jgi:Integrase zinc binding domain
MTTTVPTFITRIADSAEITWRADHFQIPSDIKGAIVRALPADPHLGAVYQDIYKRMKDTMDAEAGPITTRETFRVDCTTKMMFQISRDGYERLCLPVKAHRYFLQWAHDRLGHQGVTRVCERMRRNTYVPHLRQAVKKYVAECAVCASCKPSR